MASARTDVALHCSKQRGKKTVTAQRHGTVEPEATPPSAADATSPVPASAAGAAPPEQALRNAPPPQPDQYGGNQWNAPSACPQGKAVTTLSACIDAAASQNLRELHTTECDEDALGVLMTPMY